MSMLIRGEGGGQIKRTIDVHIEVCTNSVFNHQNVPLRNSVFISMRTMRQNIIHIIIYLYALETEKDI